MVNLLSEEKQTHLSHLILQCLQGSPEAKLIGDSILALREVKRVIAGQVILETEINQIVRNKLQSYSKGLIEGSSEWDILYQKSYTIELRKRKLA